jgi:23S rRNA (guanosine2251-2'-O)-methyltransferase
LSRLVLGVQCVREALRAHSDKVERVLIERGDSPQLAALERMAQAQFVAVERVPRASLDKLSGATRHQGAAAYAPALKLGRLEDALSPAPGLVIALDEVQDPQNFGAIVRSAVAVGRATVMWAEHASAPLSPATFRASAGAIEHARHVRLASLRTSISTMREQGAAIVALDGGATRAIFEVDLTGPTVLVVGSEGYGLRKGVKALATDTVHLPMSGAIDSLNASASAAVALYECIRQRRQSVTTGQ